MVFWPSTRPKMPFRVMHQKEVTHFNGSYERKSAVGGNWQIKWDEVKKFPWYTHRLMHRKRVTYELHDSYFRWMTINHAIPKIEWVIEWALNYYITQSRQKSELQLEIRWSYRWDVVGKATPGRRGSGPLIELGPREVADKM